MTEPLNGSQRALAIVEKALFYKPGDRHGTLPEAITNEAAARLAGTDEMLIKAVKKLLKIATPEQIEQVRSGAVNARAMVKQLQERRPSPKRRHRSTIHLAERIAKEREMRRQLRTVTWDQFRTALVNLRGLHRASDVLSEVTSVTRVPFIEENLGPALKKLQEIYDEWQSRRAGAAAQASRRDHRHDPGDGGSPAEAKSKQSQAS
jgi:hypothetical protein